MPTGARVKLNQCALRESTKEYILLFDSKNLTLITQRIIVFLESIYFLIIECTNTVLTSCFSEKKYMMNSRFLYIKAITGD